MGNWNQWRHNIIFFSLIFTASFCYSNACYIEGSTPGNSMTGWIKDIDGGIFWQRPTTDVEGIDSFSVGGVTDNRQYLNADIVDSRIQLFTTALFDEYEEHEVSHNMMVSVTFRCTGGNTTLTPQTILIHVNDTNNNPPRFMLPPLSDEFVFNIAAPMPPGYEITRCLDLIVRDIDLTTRKIIFEIQDNPFFEIQKDVYRNPSTPKEFKAIIRTKTFIRTFPEELKLTIRATDNDTTRDKPRTKETTVRFLGNTDFVLPEEPVFSKTFYLADYTDDNRVVLTEPIALQSGHDKLVQFNIRGEKHRSHFELVEDKENERSIRVIKALEGDDLEETNIHIIVTADRDLTSGASTTVVLRLPEAPKVVPLEFLSAHYQGKIEDNILRVSHLILSQGYGDGPVTATVRNVHSSYFSANVQGSTVTLSMTPLDENIVMENSFINLEIFATNGRSSATTIVTLEIIKDDNVTPIFNKPIYTGSYGPAGLIIGPIVLVQGHDGIGTVELYGEDKKYFSARLNGATVTIEIADPIPPVIYSKERIVVSLEVTKPRTVGASAAIIINLPTDSQTEDDVSFGRVLYRGVVGLDQIRHEGITITGYDRTTVEIIGQYSSMFEGSVSGGEVIVQVKGSLTLPADITHVALELHAVRARTVLLLNVLDPGVPLEPSVTFSSESYLLSVDMSQTGLVGRVSATADNGEEVTFSLGTDDAHLQTRISINNEGELYLSAPANSGVYNFQVIATTVITQVTGTASVHLTVQSAKVCDDKGIVMHPLVILERDEESAHSNLVVLDSTQHAGCNFTLTNRWPADQTWLYVNEFGLHTHSIDREHASIAFMVLSQVQVELILHCRSDTDGAIREKRSETTARLGPYDYGSNNWILTDTIPYNSRRSLVNLIVNDINDNDPIFVGKEHEPIVVGYPTDELEERILPRSLAELKATDADIGVNAALRYWSSESVLAVAPTTGFVHVRTGARLTHDQTLTVTATDENGQGRSGNILLRVKLLDLNHIAVVIIRDAFLDDETTILAQLSDAVGYEVKALRSVVISDDIDGNVTRKKREAGTPRAALQLFVYGINEREPVTVDRLATDIRANAAIANVVRTIPLEDHLQDINILNPQIGLLVATIILSVLLFIVIVVVAIWYLLRWRKTKNYDEFNDENSLPSRNASLGELPKPEAEKPRLNIADLKRSEKRLQEMLQAPIEKVTVVKKPKEREALVEAILDIPITEPSTPIVIQAIDKLKDAEESSEDEFGEVSNPKKSVVTFNENVEKIIHVEDNTGDDGDDDSASTSNINASNSRYVYKF